MTDTYCEMYLWRNNIFDVIIASSLVVGEPSCLWLVLDSQCLDLVLHEYVFFFLLIVECLVLTTNQKEQRAKGQNDTWRQTDRQQKEKSSLLVVDRLCWFRGVVGSSQNNSFPPDTTLSVWKFCNKMFWWSNFLFLFWFSRNCFYKGFSPAECGSIWYAHLTPTHLIGTPFFVKTSTFYF